MRSKARFLLSRSRAVAQYKTVKNICDTVSYSFKTNFEVGHVLEESTDSMFSVHSIESVGMIRDKSRVWFLSQAWDSEEIDALIGKGVDKFIVDNEVDLRTLLDYLAKNECTVQLLLRIRLKERTVHTGKHFVFGMFSDSAKKWLKELESNEKIARLGIHFHRKTQNLSEWSLKYELSSIFDDEDMKRMSIVNIGGGLPAEYKNFRPEVIGNIFREISELWEWLKGFGIEMHVEPGRFIAAPSVVLEANVMSVYGQNIVVDCSVWNSAMDTFVANIRLLVEGELPEGVKYCIKGSTPDSMDILRYRVYLPEVKVGDRIRFLNAGAYNFHTDFCNLPKVKTVVVD